ncbi:MAG: fibronectin type III domain-containing protein [Eggerthellaceae bacterium]
MIGRTGTRVRAVRTGLAGLVMGTALVLALGPACAQAAEATTEGADASSADSVEAAASESESSAATTSAAEGASSAEPATGAESAGGAGGNGESGDAASSGASDASNSSASSDSSASTDASTSADKSGAAGDASDPSASIELSAPVIQRIEAQSKGVLLEWGRVAHADGYDIYRWTAGTDPVRVARLESPLRRSWTDASARADTAYYYRVVAYAQVEGTSKTDTASTADSAASQGSTSAAKSNAFPADEASGGSALIEQPSSTVSCLTLSAPTVKAFSKKTSATTAKVSWTTNTRASGYQVQYATDALFAAQKTVWVRSAAQGDAVLSKLKANRTYYVRVRAYADADGFRSYSAWSSRACVRAKQRTLSKLKIGKKTFEIRTAARQKVYGYDTLQGSCSDGTFGYFALYNRTKENCKIVKVRLADGTVAKVSGVLDVAHANDLTYNPDDRIIVATRCTTNKERFTAIDPDALDVVGTFAPSLDAQALGISEKKRARIAGFSSIAYCSARQQYAVVTKGCRDLLILDRSFEPVRFMDIPHEENCNYQGIEVTDSYISLCLSATGKGQTRIMTYTWDGASIGAVTPGIVGELEGLFIAGGRCYLGTYVSAYQQAYRKVKVVKHVVKKKRVTVVRLVHGKKKRVKVVRKKKVRVVKVKYVPYTRLLRDNYLYRI